jgi:hypothetical protein
MTYATSLAKNALAVRFAVRISGIDKVWATFPLPSTWGAADVIAISGENYDWDNRLKVDSRMSAFSSTAEPKRGVGTSGGQTFRFQITGSQIDSSNDAWLNLVGASTVDRTDIDKTTLREDLLPNMTAQMEVTNSSPFSGSGDTVHVGTEAINYSTTATSPDHELETLVRGRFGSVIQTHYASFNNLLDSGAGPYVATIPLAWKGRTVTLYVIPGDEDAQGTFTPEASTLVDSENGTYAWILQGMKYEENTLELAVSANGLTSLLARPAFSNQPSATVGIDPNPDVCAAHIIMDDASNHISWLFLPFTSGAGAIGNRTGHEHIVTDAASPPTQVPDGIYTANTIARYVAQTMSNVFSLDWQVTIRRARLDGDTPDDADSSWQRVVEFSVVSSVLKNYSMRLPISDNHVLWKELGFTEEAVSDPEDLGGNETLWAFIGDRRAPVFRYPQDPLINRRVYFHSPKGAAFKAAPGWVDDNGNAIDGYVKFNGEVVRFDALSTTSIEGWSSFSYLDVQERNAFGSDAQGVYIETDENRDKVKWLEVQQGAAFPNTSQLKAFQYLALGGSGVSGFNHGTYDKGWQGGGAFIDKDLINSTAIDAIDNIRRPVRDVAFFKTGKLQDFFENEMRLDQLMLVAQTNALTVTESRPPLSGETIDHVLDDSILIAGSVVPDIDHARIINQIKFKSVFDHGKDKFLQDNGLSVQVNSLQTWGETQPLPVEIKSISDPATSAAKMQDLASHVFSRYAEPYAVLPAQTAHKKTWAWEVGETVELTVAEVPQLKTAGRGLTAVGCRIYAKSDNLFGAPAGAVRSSLVMIPQNVNGALWAPSAYVALGETSPDAGFTWTTTSNKFSGTGDPLDISNFDDNYLCRVFEVGNESTAQLRVIDNISGNDVEFTVAVTLTPPFIIEFDAYTASLIAAQRLLLFMSDGDGVLNGATNDIAYRFA